MWAAAFSGLTSNSLQIYRATDFNELATWNGYNKQDNPAIINANGVIKEVAVSCDSIGGCGLDIIRSFSIDLTDLCKEMVFKNKYMLYITFKDKCPVSSSYCRDYIEFHGVRATTESYRPVMNWTFKCKV